MITLYIYLGFIWLIFPSSLIKSYITGKSCKRTGLWPQCSGAWSFSKMTPNVSKIGCLDGKIVGSDTLSSFCIPFKTKTKNMNECKMIFGIVKCFKINFLRLKRIRKYKFQFKLMGLSLLLFHDYLPL